MINKLLVPLVALLLVSMTGCCSMLAFARRRRYILRSPRRRRLRRTISYKDWQNLSALRRPQSRRPAVPTEIQRISRAALHRRYAITCMMPVGTDHHDQLSGETGEFGRGLQDLLRAGIGLMRGLHQIRCSHADLVNRAGLLFGAQLDFARRFAGGADQGGDLPEEHCRFGKLAHARIDQLDRPG